jgi:uncharacterized protein (TIRG00374 family)
MTQQPSRRQLIRGVLVGIGLALLVLTALTVFGDVRELRTSIRDFNWWLLVPIFALTIWNYWWRFLKWEMYLNALAVPDIPRRVGIPIFLSAFAMSITPGKVGEIIKAFYVRRETNAPVERVSGAVVAERGTDAFAMLVLALVGATQFSYGRWFVAAIFAAAIAGIVMLRHPGLLERLIQLIHHIPIAKRFAHLAESFLGAMSHLLSPRLLFAGTFLGVISWMGECVAFFLVLMGLGVDPSWSLLMIAVFVLAVSSLAGGISMLPGGIGVADASVAGMLLALTHSTQMTETTAIAATLLIRFATLWFAVILGALMLLVLRRRPVVAHVGNGTPLASVGEGGYQ